MPNSLSQHQAKKRVPGFGVAAAAASKTYSTRILIKFFYLVRLRLMQSTYFLFILFYFIISECLCGISSVSMRCQLPYHWRSSPRRCRCVSKSRAIGERIYGYGCLLCMHWPTTDIECWGLPRVWANRFVILSIWLTQGFLPHTRRGGGVGLGVRCAPFSLTVIRIPLYVFGIIWWRRAVMGRPSIWE